MIWMILFPSLVMCFAIKPLFAQARGEEVTIALGRLLILLVLAFAIGTMLGLFFGIRMELAWSEPTPVQIAPLPERGDAYVAVNERTNEACYARRTGDRIRRICIPLKNTAIYKQYEEDPEAILLVSTPEFRRKELRWFGIVPPTISRRYEFLVHDGRIVRER